MRAYPTTYEGVEYRSRLEARWAAFFNQIGWRKTYEPFDADGYIPGFLIEGERPFLVEIKPATDLADYYDAVPKAERGLRDHWQRDVLILGLNPLPGQLDGTAAADVTFNPPAGLLGEFSDNWAPCWNDNEKFGTASGWSWDTGVWFSCKECGGVCVYQQVQTWVGRPCGHHDGDHLLGHMSISALDRHWARACNATQWRGSDSGNRHA
jgi:hypothetical protein